MNDVWRFMPAGSSAQNPSHTYTTSGIYKVALQVYNINGYNSTRKAGYITVNPASVAPGEWNWSIDGWNGWSHAATWSGTAVGPNYEYGPVIVNGHGEHGTYVNLLGGTTSATVGYTFNDPSGMGWNSLTFKGNITASDVPDGRWMTIHVNNQQVFSGTATSFPPGNGQDFEIQRTFPQSGAVTINISHGQNSAFGNYFVMKFDSFILT
jgi:PKD repeat protein